MKKLALLLALLYFWPEVSPFLLPCVREASNAVRNAVRETREAIAEPPPVVAPQEPVIVPQALKPREKCA